MRTSNPRKFPKGEAESSVVADASSLSPMGGAVTEEIDFAEFTSALTESEPSVALQKPCLC